MCVGSSAWSGSGKVTGERRAPPLASTPSLWPPGNATNTHLFTKKVTKFCFARLLWKSLNIKHTEFGVAGSVQMCPAFPRVAEMQAGLWSRWCHRVNQRRNTRSPQESVVEPPAAKRGEMVQKRGEMGAKAGQKRCLRHVDPRDGTSLFTVSASRVCAAVTAASASAFAISSLTQLCSAFAHRPKICYRFAYFAETTESAFKGCVLRGKAGIFLPRGLLQEIVFFLINARLHVRIG